jgi:hypothetical protein
MRATPTEAEREAAFLRYVELTENYNAAIYAAGDEPWHGGDIEKRREVFMRRYLQAAP